MSLVGLECTAFDGASESPRASSQREKGPMNWFRVFVVLCGVLGSVSSVRAQTASSQFFGDVRFRIEPVFTGLSGRADSNGINPNSNILSTQNLFLRGQLSTGGQNILRSGVNLYLNANGAWDANGSSAISRAQPDLVHRSGDDAELWFHHAYAEIDGLTAEGFLSHIHVRAGRQFHWAQEIGITFDGGTLEYNDGTLRVSARAGTRSGVYDRSQFGDAPFNGGVIAGGAFGLDFRGVSNAPLSIDAEVLYYQREFRLIDRDRNLFGQEVVNRGVTVGNLMIDWEPTPNTFLNARVLATFPEISHIKLAFQAAFDQSVLTIDLDQKLGEDLFYDFGGLDGVEVRGRRTTYESLRLNFVDRRPYTDLDVGFLWVVTPWLEIEPRVGGRIGYGASEERSIYDKSQFRYGLTAHGNFKIGRGSSIESFLGGEGWIYLDSIEGEGIFRDATSGGESLVNEFFLGLRYVSGGKLVGRRVLARRRFSAGVSAFVRTAVLDNQFIQNRDDNEFNEFVVGGQADVRWDISRSFGTSLLYEFARDSRVFYAHLDAFHAVRAAVRGSF